ncbi:hypothetical protein [Micromonospora sp. DT63]|uniref:hypothetical protein n=1 Tax=Micromonospora sp. DT63 TaxID=3393441 RepID=UPI003CE6C04E
MLLYVDTTAAYRDDETWGFHLANEMTRRLRVSFGADEVTRMLEQAALFAPPEGPHFVYEENVRLFAGRRGRGPLHVALDTNLLIDYFTYGHRIWTGDSVVDLVSSEDYSTDLESLQLVLALWAVRDIRFIMLAASVDDAKKTLSQERRGQRLLAFEEFTAALHLFGWGDLEERPSREGLLILPEREMRRALTAVPAGNDRRLVHDALQVGANVFLTRDVGILKATDALRPFGLLIATPADLFEELFACRAFHCFLGPRYLYWPAPDQQRIGHLIHALDPDKRP